MVEYLPFLHQGGARLCYQNLFWPLPCESKMAPEPESLLSQQNRAQGLRGSRANPVHDSVFNVGHHQPRRSIADKKLVLTDSGGMAMMPQRGEAMLVDRAFPALTYE